MSQSGSKIVKPRITLPSQYIFVLAAMALLYVLFLTSLLSYLLFHVLAELFSIIIACAIFTLAWNARRFLTNYYFVALDRDHF